ncbi:MAG: PD-(D/E)XK nuclease family protein [Planctomycetota bacterium]|nr:PD-(D/E)XK nuclease family protein [Planctomycetota bacterium]
MDAVAAIPVEKLSWSRISIYRDCPRRFRYRYVERVPEERVSAALPFGGAFHQAAERIAEARMAGWSIPSVEVLAGEYERAWRESVKRAPALQYAKGEDEATLRATAHRMLEAYLEFALTESGQVLAIEQEARFAVGGVPMVARLDLVELRGDELVVTDLKTAKSIWNANKIREAMPQLVAYAYAVVPFVEALGVKRIKPRFIVITKAKQPKVQVLEPVATADDAKRLKELVQETAKGVCAEVFPRHEGWQCAQCAFREECLGKDL